MKISTTSKCGIYSGVMVSAILLVFLLGMAANQVRSEKQEFSVNPKGKFIFEFALQYVGKVTITAKWEGRYPAIMTLKDPLGKVYGSKRGTSPLRLEFQSTKQLLNKGGEWKVIFDNVGSLKVKGIITIAYSPPKSAPTVKKPKQGWCCLNGEIFLTTETQCRESKGTFFSTREEAEEHCREERPQPPHPEEGWCCKDGKVFPATGEECRDHGGDFFATREEAEEHCREEHPQPPPPEEGWCCKDGKVFPATEEECHERRGAFFPTREEAEEHCREEHPQPPHPEEGWCCKDGKVFPATEEECRERGGDFFPTQEEAEEHCREERPHPPPPEEGWCCKDGKVFPAIEEECRERGGDFFATREEAERHCREEHPQPPHPEGGWCCKGGRVFPATEEECVERGGQFYVCEEDARRYCPKHEMVPRPEHEIAPPPREPRDYPAIPTANLDVDDLVPLTTLEKVVDAHAFEVWEGEIARGRPFPVADEHGDILAYVFPYIRGTSHFPEYEQIFDRVRRLRDTTLTQMGAQFGYIYVSATRRNFPILMVSHYLHPYFLVGDMAQEHARRHFDTNEVRLEKIYFINPHEEYFEFVSNGNSILINVNSLEKKSPAEALSVEPSAPRTKEHLRIIEEAWDRATRFAPVGTRAEDASKTHTEKRILHWKRIPIFPHTWWCVPTSEAMILGFWDHYEKGSGTFLGYGRLIKYWFTHPSYCHLSTGPQANCAWSSAIHNNVPNIIDDIIDPKTGTWSTGYKNLEDRVYKMYKYKFSSGTVTPTAENQWAWNDIKKEVDNGRPSFFSYAKHMVVAIGYRVTTSGQKLVIVYDTYGATSKQKLKEHTYSICNGFRWLVPGGGTSLDHLIIDSPDGGETLSRMVPYNITWWVWGVKIEKTTISFSADAGRTWTTLASDVNTKVGKNTYQWLPDKTTKKARIRIYGYTDKKELIAADGSEKDFTVKTISLNNWGNWKSLGKPPLSGHYGVERLVVGQNQDGRLEIFAVGSDGALWHKYQTTPNSGSWSGWANLGKPPGGLLLSTLAVGRNKDGRLEVVAIASDGALWHRYQKKPNQGPWIGWGSMGKPPGITKFISTPVIGQNQDGRLEVFVFGSDGALWHRYQPKPSAGPWSSWSSMGKPSGSGKFYARPAVARNKDGRLQVFAMAGTPGKSEFQLSNTALWNKYQPKPDHKGSWGSWNNMGKPSGASWPSPAVGWNKDGRLEVYVPGGDGALWHKYQTKPNPIAWSGWASLGNPPGGIKVLSQIEAAANKDGRLEVFTFGIRGKGPASVIAPWHIWQKLPNNGWGSWAGLGPLPGKNLESLYVGQNKDGRLEVFAIASDDNTLWHIRQK